jgi:hypothetical protein
VACVRIPYTPGSENIQLEFDWLLTKPKKNDSFIFMPVYNGQIRLVCISVAERSERLIFCLNGQLIELYKMRYISTCSTDLSVMVVEIPWIHPCMSRLHRGMRLAQMAHQELRGDGLALLRHDHVTRLCVCYPFSFLLFSLSCARI